MVGVERRGGARERTMLRGSVTFADGMRSVGCLVRDLSETGARLRLDGDEAVPTEFVLDVPSRRLSRRAHVVRGGVEGPRGYGVAFVGEGAAADPAARVLELEAEVATLRRRVSELVDRLASHGISTLDG